MQPECAACKQVFDSGICLTRMLTLQLRGGDFFFGEKDACVCFVVWYLLFAVVIVVSSQHFTKIMSNTQ